MNLIQDPWIPVRRRNGIVSTIEPWRMTEGSGANEIIELAAPRPDFNGALIQFLIGLVQTTLAPSSSSEWRTRFNHPPITQELQSAFQSIEQAFNFDGDGPRFMQDMALPASPEASIPIDTLLIDAPGENTVKANKDHFVKRSQIKRLCPACAATALFALQINAPSGGQGHRTGLRGGGPLTTLILGDSLWSTVWLNTLERDVFLSKSGNLEKNAIADRFPWMGPTRTSERGQTTTPEDAHPDQNFWSMPRRIRLLPTDSDESVGCDLCDQKSVLIYERFVSKNYGTNYEGPWMHSLSPYFVDPTGAPSAIHPQPGGIGYRHWMGLVQSAPDKKGTRQPARVLNHFVRQRPSNLRLWAFGYDMDNMKARCWYDSTMPLVLVDESQRVDYESLVASLVAAAQLIARETRNQIKNAFFKPSHEVNGDLSFVQMRFWQETEAEFFVSLQEIRVALQAETEVLPMLNRWHAKLCRTAEIIFDNLSQNGTLETADPKRIALAWNNLQKNIRGKKMRAQLGIPESASLSAS